MKIPAWLIRNLPTIARIVVRLVESRPAKGNFKKTGVLFLALSMTTCATLRDQVDDFCKRNPRECNEPVPSPTPPDNRVCERVQDCNCWHLLDGGGRWFAACGSPAPSPSPVPTPEPSPSVEPSPIPTPSPSATPAPIPSPCVQPSPAMTCARPHDPSISEDPAICWKCSDLRGWQVAQGNWIDHHRPDGWLEDNVGSGRYVTKDCDVVRNDGTLLHLREDGYLWNVCPRMDAQCPAASPKPCASPTPVPSPTPTPSGTPALTESGNFPRPEIGSCPPWFRDAVSEVGISVLPPQRKCGGKDAPPDCTITNLNATEKSVKPYCEHSCYSESGTYSLSNCRLKCETWGGCQQPPIVNGNSGIQMLISHPDWGNVFDVCDKRTCDERFESCPPLPDPRKNFICHDQAINRSGVTQAKACEPDRSKCGPTITFRSLP